MTLRRAQAMLETLISVLFVTFILLVSVQLVQMYNARILLDHAAERAARAKAVGLNDFMCLKSARVAMIPVAGNKTWPQENIDEVARIPIYLSSDHGARARAILDYERWANMNVSVSSEYGISPIAETQINLETDEFSVNGESKVESHYPLYMEGFGF